MPDEKLTNEGVEIRLKWPLDDGTQAVFANQFSISQAGPEIVLGFGAFLPTSFSNRSESEVKEYLQGASINVVAKVVVTQEGLKAFHILLKDYIEHRIENRDQEKQ